MVCQASWDLARSKGANADPKGANFDPKGANGDLMREASVGSVGSTSGQPRDAAALIVRLTRQVIL